MPWALSHSWLESADLASLRDGALQAAAEESEQQEVCEEAPQMFDVTEFQAGLPPVWEEGPPEVEQHSARVLASQASPPVPDDDGSAEVISVHSSSTPTSAQSRPSPLKRSSGVDATLARAALFEGAHAAAVGSSASAAADLASLPGSISQLRDPRLHGVGMPLAPAGFTGRGPFWTCGPKRRANAQASVGEGGGSSSSSSRPESNAAAFSSGAASVAGECIDLLAQAIQAGADARPPEQELTTVLLETKEQRIQWREFLSEAVARSGSSAIFASYDVEAEPPRYNRPPCSRSAARARAEVAGAGEEANDSAAAAADTAAVPAASSTALPAVRSPSPAPPLPGGGKGPRPHVVAPNGAGWSPVMGSVRRRLPEPNSSEKASADTGGWWFETCKPRTARPLQEWAGSTCSPARPVPFGQSESEDCSVAWGPESESTECLREEQAADPSSPTVLLGCPPPLEEATGDVAKAADPHCPTLLPRPAPSLVVAEADAYAPKGQLLCAPASSRRPAPAG